ncbi:MAG: PAS domain-containing protein [Sphingomonas sp.]
MSAAATSPLKPGKAPADALLPDSGHVVTASTLVRHFGSWQDRAIQQPVYILHRGRPRFVLASIEIMQALCAPHEGSRAASANASFEALLALTPQLVVICDPAMEVVAMSAAAERYFGRAHAQGSSLAALADGSSLERLSDAIHRVVATGHAEDVDAAPARYTGRRLLLTLHPHPIGVAIVAQDASAVDDLQDARAAADAQEQAIVASGVAASARLSLRGYVENVSASLTRLTGLSSAALAGARFATLLDIADRARFGHAVERVIQEGGAGQVSAALHTRHAGAVPVTIGLSAIRHCGTVTSIAMIVVHAAGLEGLKAP